MRRYPKTGAVTFSEWFNFALFVTMFCAPLPIIFIQHVTRPPAVEVPSLSAYCAQPHMLGGLDAAICAAI